MAVTGHSLATLAGLAALKRGGTVIDALIAASAASAVVLGHATSIGGDCFLLYREAASGRTLGLNASGVAPAAATPAVFAAGMKTHGPLAPVVPGLVRGWEVLHRRYGRLAWPSLFEDAIALAHAHPISQVLANRIALQRDLLAGDPGCAALYLPGGRPVATGETLRQPALAATLQRIAEGGADAFYFGEMAAKIDGYFAQHGGLLRASDLAGFAPLWVEPAATTYREHRVRVMPPNSYGVLLLMQLNGLAALDSATLSRDPAHRLAYQMSAMKAAFAEGRPEIADPTAAAGAVERLLSPAMTEKMQTAVRDGIATVPVRDSSGTSCLVFADREGNAVTMVQSVFNPFGSAFLEPETGILFNNRMHGFTHLPGRANSVGPGKRPAHTLCPVMVERGDRLRFALASPGGLSQTLTNAQVLCRLLDEGLDVAAAVEAPRWCNTRGGELLIEREFPESMIATLAALGHKVRRADDGYYYGSAKAIELLPSGNLAGAGDHRREAFAGGF